MFGHDSENYLLSTFFHGLSKSLRSSFTALLPQIFLRLCHRQMQRALQKPQFPDG